MRNSRCQVVPIGRGICPVATSQAAAQRRGWCPGLKQAPVLSPRPSATAHCLTLSFQELLRCRWPRVLQEGRRE